MKHPKLIILSIALALSVFPPAHSQPTDRRGASVIRPGESIGQTHLGAKGGFDLKKLPQPDLVDNYTSHSAARTPRRPSPNISKPSKFAMVRLGATFFASH